MKRMWDTNMNIETHSLVDSDGWLVRQKIYIKEMEKEREAGGYNHTQHPRRLPPKKTFWGRKSKSH